MSRVEAILTDFDGTLYDSEKANVDYLRRIAVEIAGLELPTTYFRERLHLPIQPFVEELAEDQPDKSDDFYEAAKLLPYHDEWVTLMPGADETVRALSDRQWAIVTSRKKASTQRTLERDDLGTLFTAISAYGDYRERKPHPEPVLLACKRLRVQPGRAVYIGDHQVDVESGQAAGTTSIFFGSSAESYGAEFCISTWSELPEVIADLEAEVG